MKIIKELIPYLIIILVVVLIRTFIITPVIVNGESMKPTLDGGEVMLLKKYDSNFKRFDIIVVSKSVDGSNLIKRIIGLPNETLEYKHNKLYINDKVVDDSFGVGKTGDIAKIELGEDEYFVMGDNRGNSKDSRELGVIKKSELEGTVEIILYPFNKFGKVK